MINQSIKKIVTATSNAKKSKLKNVIVQKKLSYYSPKILKLLPEKNYCLTYIPIANY